MSFYPESQFDHDCSIGYLARRVVQLSSIGLDPAFAPAELSLTQWSALNAILCGRASTPAELARDLAYDTGFTSRLVDTLVERGLILRTRNSDDRRVVDLALTARGGTVAEECRARVINCWNDWLADWSPEDACELVRLLIQLRSTLQRHIKPGTDL